MFKLLAENSTVDNEGSRHVPSLLNNLQVDGSNGMHEVLVTEVLASLSDLQRYPVYKMVRTNEMRTLFYLKSTSAVYLVPKTVRSTSVL
jgi:hypothetical protein